MPSAELLRASALTVRYGPVAAVDAISMSVSTGEVVGLLAPSRPEWVMAFLAIVGAGGIVLPLSEQITAPELQRLLGHSNCRRICTTKPFVAILEALNGDAGAAGADRRAIMSSTSSALP